MSINRTYVALSTLSTHRSHITIPTTIKIPCQITRCATSNKTGNLTPIKNKLAILIWFTRSIMSTPQTTPQTFILKGAGYEKIPIPSTNKGPTTVHSLMILTENPSVEIITPSIETGTSIIPRVIYESKAVHLVINCIEWPVRKI